MKYQDLHAKVMFINPHSSWGGKGWWSIFIEIIVLGIEWKCPNLYRKVMFVNLQIGKSWGQFTKISVLHIALFCALGPYHPTLCGNVGN